jgi:hypothetical protein
VGRRLRDQVFVVRTWLESPPDAHTMRGRIDHVASGRRRYFANFGDLCDFISATPFVAPADDGADRSDPLDDTDDEAPSPDSEEP